MDSWNNSSATLASPNSPHAASPIVWGAAHPRNETEQMKTTNRTRSLLLQWADEQFNNHVQHYHDQEDDDERFSYILSWNRIRSPLELQRRLKIWLEDRYTFYSHYFGSAKYLAEEIHKALVQARDGVTTKDDARLVIQQLLDMNGARNIALTREDDRLHRDAEFLVQSLLEQSVRPYSEGDFLDALHNAYNSWDSASEVQVAVALQLVDGSMDYETTLMGYYQIIAQHDPVESITATESMWVDVLDEVHNSGSLLQTWRTWTAIVTSIAIRMKDCYETSTEEDSGSVGREDATERGSDEPRQISQSSRYDDGTDPTGLETPCPDTSRKNEKRSQLSPSDSDVDEWREEYNELKRWTRKRMLPPIPENEQLRTIDEGSMLRGENNLQEGGHLEEQGLAHVKGPGHSQGQSSSTSSFSEEARTSQAGEFCCTNPKRSSNEEEPTMEYQELYGTDQVLEQHGLELEGESSTEEEDFSVEEETVLDRRDHSPVGFGYQRDNLSTSRHLLQHNGAMSSRSIHFEWW